MTKKAASLRLAPQRLSFPTSEAPQLTASSRPSKRRENCLRGALDVGVSQSTNRFSTFRRSSIDSPSTRVSSFVPRVWTMNAPRLGPLAAFAVTRTSPHQAAVAGRVRCRREFLVLAGPQRRAFLRTKATPLADAKAAATATSVGFIGLGNMGMGMASNLRKKGAPVIAFDSSERAAVEASTAHGLAVVSSAKYLLAGPSALCQVIFTMLPGCSAVHAVMSELFDARESDTKTPPSPLVIVDCSTVSPSTSRHWHDRWQGQGVHFIDAPVSGGVKGAADATLTFMVGCPPESPSLETVRPFLDRMGRNVIPCGAPGTGSATKLCNNLALAAQMIGVCEAMNLGEALGVDPNVLASVMNQSTAGCWSSQVNNPHPAVAKEKGGSPASRDYQGGFAASLMLKDLGLAVAAAEDAGVSTPLTATSKELYKLVRAHGLGGKDFGVLLQFLRGSR